MADITVENPATSDADEQTLREQQQTLRLEIADLLRLVETADTAEEARNLYLRLAAKRQKLHELDQTLMALQSAQSSVVLETQPEAAGTRAETDSLLALKVERGLMHVPTAICHLLDSESFALIRCEVTNTSYEVKRRVRVRCWVEGYSAECVTTFEVPPLASSKAALLPTFFPVALQTVRELTLATLHLVVDDLDSDRVQQHETYPIWLLARNSAPLRVRLGSDQGWIERDMRDYWAAFVTPHDPEVLAFLRKVAERHPKKALGGYQDLADAQARAIYDALKVDLKALYVNSFIDFNPDNNSSTQRVRLPRETLSEKQANCIDGALLFASLLEAISLRPGLIILPGHAIVAWRPTEGSTEWRYLDTTKIAPCDFDVASQFGQIAYDALNTDPEFRVLDITELRRRIIMPLT